MLAAFLTTIFFSISVICGHRSARIIGGSEANFWRLAVAAFFLGGWAFLFGQGVSGETFPLFLLSGLVGIGFGDVALFQALPRLGPRLTLLLTRCLAPPFAAAIEWLWLGTTLRTVQILYASLVLAGIGISLWPDRSPRLLRSEILPGVIFAALAAMGDGFGAMLSRKAYSVVGMHAAHIDGATAAFPEDHRRAVHRRNFSAGRKIATGPTNCPSLEGEMAASLAVGAGQRTCRPDDRRELLSVGLSDDAGRCGPADRRHHAVGGHADHAPDGSRADYHTCHRRRDHRRGRGHRAGIGVKMIRHIVRRASSIPP